MSSPTIKGCFTGVCPPGTPDLPTFSSSLTADSQCLTLISPKTETHITAWAATSSFFLIKNIGKKKLGAGAPTRSWERQRPTVGGSYASHRCEERHYVLP